MIQTCLESNCGCRLDSYEIESVVLPVSRVAPRISSHDVDWPSVPDLLRSDVPLPPLGRPTASRTHHLVALSPLCYLQFAVEFLILGLMFLCLAFISSAAVYRHY